MDKELRSAWSVPAEKTRLQRLKGPPGRHVWTWFTGVALIAGGVGMLVPKTARLAALMSGIMMFLWVVVA